MAYAATETVNIAPTMWTMTMCVRNGKGARIVSIEEIFKIITSEADVCEELAEHTVDIGVKQKLEKKVFAFREAIALLKTLPDAQPNEPLTLEED